MGRFQERRVPRHVNSEYLSSSAFGEYAKRYLLGILRGAIFSIDILSERDQIRYGDTWRVIAYGCQLYPVTFSILYLPGTLAV